MRFERRHDSHETTTRFLGGIGSCQVPSVSVVVISIFAMRGGPDMPAVEVPAAAKCVVCGVGPCFGARLPPALPCGHVLCASCQVGLAKAFNEGGRAVGRVLRCPALLDSSGADSGGSGGGEGGGGGEGSSGGESSGGGESSSGVGGGVGGEGPRREQLDFGRRGTLPPLPPPNDDDDHEKDQGVNPPPPPLPPPPPPLSPPLSPRARGAAAITWVRCPQLLVPADMAAGAYTCPLFQLNVGTFCEARWLVTRWLVTLC